MTDLIAAAAVFFAIHIFISGTRIRDGFVGAIGEPAYMGLFSLASLGVIAWMAIAFNHAGAERGGGADPMLYDLGMGARHAAIPLVALAFLLGVPGLLTPNPTSVKGEALAARPDAVKGVLRITRHPFLWGVALWSAVHLANNGDLAGVIFFGTFLLLAVFGTLSIDAKRRRKLGAAWDRFAGQTSNLPFAAILSGRNSFRAREYFDWRFLLAAILFLAILFGHGHMFGVSPLV